MLITAKKQYVYYLFCIGSSFFYNPQTNVIQLITVSLNLPKRHFLHDSSSHYCTYQFTYPYCPYLPSPLPPHSYPTKIPPSLRHPFIYNCPMTCRAITKRTFTSVEELLSVFTIHPNNLNRSGSCYAVHINVLSI